ncbi:hypothetical protein HYU15_01290 [Candidatus Woesearchaeota archaeon]|nr:hypothetical protein [Candidatus Woesearchaeota archaeon]
MAAVRRAARGVSHERRESTSWNGFLGALDYQANRALALLGLGYALTYGAVMPIAEHIEGNYGELEQIIGKITLGVAGAIGGKAALEAANRIGEYRLIRRSASAGIRGINSFVNATAAVLNGTYKLVSRKGLAYEPADEGRRKAIKAILLTTGAAYAKLQFFTPMPAESRGLENSAIAAGGFASEAPQAAPPVQQPQQGGTQPQAAQYKIQISDNERGFLERVLMAEISDYDPSYPAKDYRMAIQNVINVIDNRRKSDWFPNQPDFLAVLTAANQFSAVWEPSNRGFYFNPDRSFKTSIIGDSDLEVYAGMRNWHRLPEQMRRQRMALVTKKLEFIRQGIDAFMKGEASNLMPEDVVYYKNSDFTDEKWHNRRWQLGYLTCFLRQDPEGLPSSARHEYYIIRTGIPACP